ncbi:hypothetical protein K474DRAFT_58656 [Panus rudis PR-1116 ss-1]|nr:hypothetical protein K474DRAFT_58656 [Panus rudis PR-1116 ss-1]
MPRPELTPVMASNGRESYIYRSSDGSLYSIQPIRPLDDMQFAALQGKSPEYTLAPGSRQSFPPMSIGRIMEDDYDHVPRPSGRARLDIRNPTVLREQSLAEMVAEGSIRHEAVDIDHLLDIIAKDRAFCNVTSTLKWALAPNPQHEPPAPHRRNALMVPKRGEPNDYPSRPAKRQAPRPMPTARRTL